MCKYDDEVFDRIFAKCRQDMHLEIDQVFEAIRAESKSALKVYAISVVIFAGLALVVGLAMSN